MITNPKDKGITSRVINKIGNNFFLITVHDNNTMSEKMGS